MDTLQLYQSLLTQDPAAGRRQRSTAAERVAVSKQKKSNNSSAVTSAQSLPPTAINRPEVRAKFFQSPKLPTLASSSSSSSSSPSSGASFTSMPKSYSSTFSELDAFPKSKLPRDNGKEGGVEHDLTSISSFNLDSNAQDKNKLPEWKIPLSAVPISLQISDLLVTGVVENPPVVTIDDQPVDVAILTCLALNQQARQTGNSPKLPYGIFKHLPLRENVRFGHPCDLVFLPYAWTEEQILVWDEANWETRVDLCAAIHPYHKYEVSTAFHTNDADTSIKVVPMSVRALRSASTSTSVGSSRNNENAPRYTTTSDPITNLGGLSHSFTLDDQTIWMILLNTVIGRPVSCRLEDLQDSLEFRDISPPATLIYSAAVSLGEDPQHLSRLSNTTPRNHHIGAAGYFDDIIASLFKAVNEEINGTSPGPLNWGDLLRTWSEIQNVMLHNQRSRWATAC